MFISCRGTERSGRTVVWVALALGVVFLALVAFQKFYADRLRLHSRRRSHGRTGRRDLRAARRFGTRCEGLAAVARPAPRRRRDRSGPPCRMALGRPETALARLRRRRLLVVCRSRRRGIQHGGTAGQQGGGRLLGRRRRQGTLASAYDPAGTFDYGGPRATPTIDGNSLFTVSSSGVLMCLDAADGKSPPTESFYSQRGHRLPYQIVVVNDASGPRLDNVSDRPGVIYYAVSSDQQQYWVTMTGLLKDTSSTATLKRLIDRPNESCWSFRHQAMSTQVPGTEI